MALHVSYVQEKYKIGEDFTNFVKSQDKVCEEKKKLLLVPRLCNNMKPKFMYKLAVTRKQKDKGF